MATNEQRRMSKLISDEDIAQAREQVATAVTLMGLGSNRAGKIHCPNRANHDSGVPKAAVKADGWVCPKCRIGGDAIKMLTDYGGYDFVDAVLLLNGKPARGGKVRPPKEIITIVAEPEFEAVVDVEVYTAIRDHGTVDEAVRFYGRFGITADAVEVSGATYVKDMDGLHRHLLDVYGRDRLVAAGVIKPEAGRSKNDYWLVNRDYPVIEPHQLPDGQIVGLQFRGSVRTENRIRRIKDAKAAGRTNRDGSPLNIPPKFLSLRGAGVRSRVGLNLPRIAAVSAAARKALADAGHDPDQAPPEGAETHTIWIVEGFKDVLAMTTMGYVSYGIPGTNFPPVKGVCDLLRPCLVKIALDGDESGAKGRELLKEHFTRHNIRWVEKIPPEGKDMCDILVDKLKRNAA